MDDVKIKALRTIGLAQAYFVDTKKAGFTRYVAEPGKFMDRDGSMWLREGSGTSARHAYGATYFRRVQNFCRNPGAQRAVGRHHRSDPRRRARPVRSVFNLLGRSRVVGSLRLGAIFHSGG